jgi:hypothetical protein
MRRRLGSRTRNPIGKSPSHVPDGRGVGVRARAKAAAYLPHSDPRRERSWGNGSHFGEPGASSLLQLPVLPLHPDYPLDRVGGVESQPH